MPHALAISITGVRAENFRKINRPWPSWHSVKQLLSKIPGARGLRQIYCTSQKFVVPAKAETQSAPRFEKYDGLDSSLRWNDGHLGLTECHETLRRFCSSPTDRRLGSCRGCHRPAPGYPRSRHSPGGTRIIPALANTEVACSDARSPRPESHFFQP